MELGHKKYNNKYYNKREYQAWFNMKARCNNPNRKDYKYYGAKGITYHYSWEYFVNFLADMGDCPSGFTLERIDINKNYNKQNCKWIEKSKQMKNTSTVRQITLNGKTQILVDWCRELNRNYGCVRRRLALGWSEERALNTETPTGFDIEIKERWS